MEQPPNCNFSGKWGAYDFRCQNQACISGPSLYQPQPRVPALTLTWREVIQLDNGTFRTLFNIDGQFVRVLVGIDGISGERPDRNAQLGCSAVGGRLPTWYGRNCPHCDEINYAGTTDGYPAQLALSARIIGLLPSGLVRIRFDSQDALDLWMEFDVPSWMTTPAPASRA